MSKDKVKLIAVCLFAAFFSDWFIGNLYMTKTNSVKYRLFWKSNWREATVNEYVYLDKLHSYLTDHGVGSVIKKVGCDQGQTLKKKDNRFRCDGVVIAISLFKDGKGGDLPVFDFNGVIPQGKAFLVAQHKNSFDSRYFGLINKSDTKKVSPII
jgi:conjugal transfer pilin signal peptidase TrbI